MQKRTKRILLIIVLLALAGGAWYGWSEWNRTEKDLTGAKADFTIAAQSLIAEFEQDTARASAANRKYADKLLSVRGLIAGIDSTGGQYALSLGDTTNESRVVCSMDDSHAAEFSTLKRGDSITVIGRFVHGDVPEIEGLGATVNIRHSVLQNEK
jgi:hypothetical protein